MGPKEKFHDFVEIVRESSKKHPISFVYASFDFKIEEDVLSGGAAGCLLEGDNEKQEQKNHFDCKTIYIPNTTWTEGRNLLAEEAVRQERENGYEYKYWIFADDDLTAHCDSTNCTVGNDRHNQNICCWSRVLSFFEGDDIPDRVTSISASAQLRNKFLAVSNVDAMFQAFKREYIPYVMPYATLPKNASQWTSQAALFCVFQTCFRSSVMYIPNVKMNNTEHRTYARGMDMTLIKDVIAKNYHDSAAGFFPCADIGHNQINQNFQPTAMFRTAEELNQVIPPHSNLTKCKSLIERYNSWEKMIK
jgi:hypothetical protein